MSLEMNDINQLLKWSRQKSDNPLYKLARAWIEDEEPSKDLLEEGVKFIYELAETEECKYDKFEVMRIRDKLLSMMTGPTAQTTIQETEAQRIKRLEAQHKYLADKNQKLKAKNRILSIKAKKYEIAKECLRGFQTVKAIIDGMRVGDMTLATLEDFKQVRAVADDLNVKYKDALKDDEEKTVEINKEGINES